jgi:hypothetical protein
MGEFPSPRRRRLKITLLRSSCGAMANEVKDMPNEIPSYNELQLQIHDDLRVQHPEWVEPNGECPTCDSYELRLAELLGLNQRSNPAAAC